MKPTYSINITAPDVSVLAGHLRMGGTNPAGVELNATSRYLTLGGHPWLPVMGEFHYTRCPRQSWRDELLKMKAGGIQIAATYIFWIHHEEIEGQVDWHGPCDLRHFIELCGECGLFAYPRLGPWAHGEARNGGFPDWLLERCGRQVRGDFPLYLSYVRAWYRQIAAQLHGLSWQAGGPIVGLQLENELADNPGHILTLKRLALEAGMQAPLYTMTGWGPAEVPEGNEVLPVFGGYPDAPWDRQVEDWSRPARKHYFFHRLRDDNAIGSDLLKPRPDANQPPLEAYPFACCEIGGGVMPTYHRRSYVSAEDVAALAMVKIGCGNNLQGYYMYHGGSNPPGRLTSLQESQATGYWNDYPQISYDFQAPLGEYGQPQASYHALRRLHLFLADFGAGLAPLPLVLPEQMPQDVDDRATLRWSARSDGLRGYLFLNNYQRIEALPAHPGMQFSLALKNEELLIPRQPVDIPGGTYAIWPFNLDLEGICLQYATAQLICRVQDGAVPYYIFSACQGIAPEFVFSQAGLETIEGVEVKSDPNCQVLAVELLTPGIDCSFILHGKAGQTVKVIVLTSAQSHQCYKLEFDRQERLFLSPAGLFTDQGKLHLRTRTAGEAWLAVFPPLAGQLVLDGVSLPGVQSGVFTVYHLPVAETQFTPVLQRIRPAGPTAPVQIGSQGVATPPTEAAFELAETWQVGLLPATYDHGDNAYLVVDYYGDIARAYTGDQLIADNFFNGRKWEIGLQRFMTAIRETGVRLQFLPLRKDAPIYLPREYRRQNAEEALVELINVSLVVETEHILQMLTHPT